jgi:hypothetical protein
MVVTDNHFSSSHSLCIIPSQADALILHDFLPYNQSIGDARDALETLMHIDHVLTAIRGLEATIQEAKKEGKDISQILANSHMVFTGSPGSGKNERRGGRRAGGRERGFRL